MAAQQVEVETEKTDKYGRSGRVLLQGSDVNLAVVAAVDSLTPIPALHNVLI